MITENELVLNHIYLADQIAINKARNLYTIRIDELKSAAYLGLVDAASKYDVEKCNSFPAYASLRIYGSIQDYLRELSWGGRSNRLKVTSGDEDVLEQGSDDPDQEEMFDFLIEQLDDRSRKIVSLYYRSEWKIKDIAKEIGVNESRISQILSQAREELRAKWSEQEAELWSDVA
jgi:RNA polymerase sigma factor (sigma-70 family)